MNTFFVGDIHGGLLAFLQVLEKSGFDKEKDRLICAGDYCDGWSQVKEVIDELMTIKNLIPLLGNHDQWTIDFYTGKMKMPSYLSKRNIDEDNVYFKLSDRSEFQLWYTQGGKATIDSFGSDIEEKYLNFLKNLQPYHYENDKMFCHAGFDFTEEKLEEQTLYYLIWDRHLIHSCHSGLEQLENYAFTSMFYKMLKEIYVGHTPTISFNKSYTTPQKWGKMWAMDTGACYTGKLSMINIDTKEIFQSDEVMKLYPNEIGRNDKSWNSLNKNKFS